MHFPNADFQLSITQKWMKIAIGEPNTAQSELMCTIKTFNNKCFMLFGKNKVMPKNAHLKHKIELFSRNSTGKELFSLCQTFGAHCTVTVVCKQSHLTKLQYSETHHVKLLKLNLWK